MGDVESVGGSVIFEAGPQDFFRGALVGCRAVRVRCTGYATREEDVSPAWKVGKKKDGGECSGGDLGAIWGRFGGPSMHYLNPQMCGEIWGVYDCEFTPPSI